MTPIATFSPLPALSILGPRWQALEARAQGSFFLGWTWMDSWLAASGATPELLAVRVGDQDVALALIGWAMQPRLLGGVTTLALNQSGQASQDRGFIEYNGLLVAADAAPGVDAAVMSALLARHDWRALRLAGVTPDQPLLAQGRFRRRVRTDGAPAYQVDLNAVRGAGGDYLSLLSANTRSQIKRSFKDHGGSDPTIMAAATEEQVREWLVEMAALNSGRHIDNAWDDAGFRAFAEGLALRGLVNASVELLRISIGDSLIGLLLNFVYRGRAMNYQSAFAAPITAKAKPGLMCHVAAVGRYAEAGLEIYSLLAGKDRYKQSLATSQEALEWWTLERFSLRLEGEALLRRLLRRPASEGDDTGDV